MKRKTICLLCVLAMLVIGLASAEDIFLTNAGKVYTGRTTVIFTVGEYYEVVIPPSVPISYGTENTDLVLTISDLELTQGYRLSIGVQSPEGVLAQADGDGVIPYTLEDEQGLFDERFFDAMQDVPLRLHVNKEDWHAAPAGSYDGRITFSVIPKYMQEGE